MEHRFETLLQILPDQLRSQVSAGLTEEALELRLRVGERAELVCAKGSVYIPKNVTASDLNGCINLASSFSPWTTASMSMGYLTAKGGHRIGICGEVILRDGQVTGFRRVDSLCIRICRDVPGAASNLKTLSGSTLILGAPGWGKTTLLRDHCRRLSGRFRVCVVDEREELFPQGFVRGPKMDVLTLCPKPIGMEMVLKAMNPEYIAVDEITSTVDCEGLIHCVGCGVKLLATAHAGSFAEFRSRPLYKPLMARGVFDHVVTLHPDRTYHVEELSRCG